MNFELFIALRYLLALRKQAFISVISLFAVFGVCLGVASLIVVMGVMNGFSTDLRDKILGVNAHVIVMNAHGAMTGADEIARQAADVTGVTGATPFIYSEVMVSTPRGVKGVVLRGIEPESSSKVLSLSKDMLAGKVEDLDREDTHPGIIVGQELAARLGLSVGSMVNLLSPTGSKSAAGFMPKVKFFTVTGIFKTGMFEYDSSMAYVSLTAARDLLGFSGDVVSGIELRLADVYAAEHVSRQVESSLGGYPFLVRNWMEMNANLFAALKLEKTAMFIFLVLIVLVGSFSIITTLVMLVIQKTRDIAVLMSMGAKPREIQHIFMLQGTTIGVLGTLLGYLLGVPVSLLLKKYQFIELPRDVYPVDYLPVRLELLDMTLIGLAAMGLCFVATLYPARKASRLNPADALRYE
ncbi:lipoprotein-releasing ABC transporter permease subunit [Desulfocurvibacter africanus]|uniref:Lipoprotein releasing system, transmembrane protein, LolC/E family n=1 Tax=Desulfocurvibacter africanus subsp. africanus str. Walvis Bay TaxID=690850 RepID=F3Z0Z2_DESAF|nr:lipoprotein-releasing ABC transporter permease subunit [Desulfocurvibacter africanus]EGJ51070.1 lipoprotein releasing system, transmembrane protein, LolC/E family [Desulfocurvibacter africanus subsp. africanus str. Walvis Bay]